MSFMKKFIHHVSQQIGAEGTVEMEISRGMSCGIQTFQESDSTGVVGKSIVHASAMKQVTGEAMYVDDMPKLANELYGVIVQSSEAHAKILSVDCSRALAYPGVVDYVSWKDIPNFKLGMDIDGRNPNVIGPVFKGLMGHFSYSHL